MYEDAQDGNGGAGILFLFLLAVVVCLSWNPTISYLQSLQVHTNGHAEISHPGDAQAIRRCLDKNGPYMIMKHKHMDQFYLLCRLDTGRWAYQVVDQDGEEITAFPPDGDGTWNAVKARLDTFATRYTKTLPWLQ